MKTSPNTFEISLLFLLFLTLKLCHLINWSWWWVTAPLWGFASIFLITLIIFLIIKLFKRK